MIVHRDTVKACVERAMLLDTSGDAEARLEAAIASTAQALHLPVETVRECVEQREVATC